MPKIIFRMRFILAVIILVGIISCVSAVSNLSSAEEIETDYQAVISNLKELIENTPTLKAQIDESIKVQDEKSYWHKKSSDDFIKFFAEWLVYNPQPEAPGKYVRIFDEFANSGGAGEILLNNNVFSSWFIAFINARAQYLDTERSAAILAQWMKYPDLRINEYIVPKGGFKTFNEFFLRKVKPEARPLDGKDDSSVIVSPADGSICQIYAEDLDTNYKIKRDVINIRQALNNSPYADKFIGGAVVDILLWFTDYHHFHAPISGKIVSIGEYAGSYNYNFRNVNWYRQLAKHKRSCYIIETENFGLVAMIPIGFWTVGSIVTECKLGDYIKKGEEIGYFKYGGSSILLVFEPNAVKFTIPIPVQDNGDKGIPVKVRQKIGIATRR